ncbi:CCAR1 protein, partial [Polypterus senegalus]
MHRLHEGAQLAADLLTRHRLVFDQLMLASHSLARSPDHCAPELLHTFQGSIQDSSTLTGMKHVAVDFPAHPDSVDKTPQTIKYLFVFDVSQNAIRTGYLKIICPILLETLNMFTNGSLYYYPAFHSVRSQELCEKIQKEFHLYLSRSVGAEAVLRVSCTKGLIIENCLGNCVQQSPGVFCLPTVTPDTQFALQMSISKCLLTSSSLVFQSCLLYTSCKEPDQSCDERMFIMYSLKTLPLSSALKVLKPDLYRIDPFLSESKHSEVNSVASKVLFKFVESLRTGKSVFPVCYIISHQSLITLFSILAALSVQQPSLLGASPGIYSQQSALAAASLNSQSAASYQLSQQTAALQQQAAAAAAALQQYQQQQQQQQQPPPPQQTLYSVQQQTQPQGQPLLKTTPTMLQSLPPTATFSVQAQAQTQPPALLQAQLSAASLAPLLQNPPQPLLPQPPQKGLLQPPVRMIPQPQPARRIDPTPRLPSRNDRGDPIGARKEDRSVNCDMMELRRRYQNLYIPSDFFDAEFTWVDAFPISRPFHFGNYCSFHIMHKEVEPLVKNTAVLDPSDANHLYSAKVMLLANPSLDDLYHKSCALADDPQEVREAFQHPARLIKFLVGMKGKDEAMAIGGHWSPSLDGINPESDPSVLIKTAVRCCKALTGIDLSLCTQWYRFAEIRYHRPEETHKGRTVPAHVETVVLFLPDVWHCLPTRSEWETLSRGYKQQLEEEEKDEGELKEISTPTHWSKLDPKSMKVNDLRKELESRSLSSKGLKSQLIARLMKQLKVEEQTDELKEPEKTDNTEEEEEEQMKAEEDKEEEEKRRLEEVERQRRERRYILPDEPTIVVHPNWAAKNGKFDCSIMSLSVLLDYRLEDNKEHSFEVSLFAELFNEMLQRDFGYRIYKAVASLPQKDEKTDKKEKVRKDDKKDTERKEVDKKDYTKSKESRDEDNVEPIAKRNKLFEEKEERKDDKEKRKEELKEEDEIDEESNNATAEEYDPMEAEEAEEDDEDEKEDEETNGKDRRDYKRDERKNKERSSKDKEKEKKQMVTYNKDLLMAFVYFDQSHCGYLLEKDLEEIIYTLGLHLSRAQVKKLLNKTVVRESCFYRKLTDCAKDEAIPFVNEPPQESLLGNKALLPCHKLAVEKNESPDSGTLIIYNGAMVDIGSLMQKLEKSEKAREEIEQKLQCQETKQGL